jgi:hypothetical protein
MVRDMAVPRQKKFLFAHSKMMGHYLTMIMISLVSGLLSGMWVWTDKLSDIRLSINDLYMAGLMTALMIFFMALLDRHSIWIAGSAIVVGFILWGIRTQAFVSKSQYFQGMIPHHSMAVLTSKRLLGDPTLMDDERKFVEQIIATQEREITWMKSIIYNN